MTQIYSLDFNKGTALVLTQLTEMNMRNINPFTNKACLVDSAQLYSETALLDEAVKLVQKKITKLSFSRGARGLIHKGERLVIYGMRHYSADAITLLGEHIYAPTKKNPFRYRILPDANGYIVIDTKGNERYCTLAELKQHVLTNAYIVRGQVYGDTTQYCTWALPDANHTGYYDYQEHNMLAAWNKTAELPFEECPIITAKHLHTGYCYTGFSSVVLLDEDVTVIPTSLFLGCTELTTVACRGENIVIGTEAFANKKSLNLLHIPGGVRLVQKSAFYNTPRLHRIYLRLRNSEAQLCSYAFYGSGLCSLTIKAEKPVKEIQPD